MINDKSKDSHSPKGVISTTGNSKYQKTSDFIMLKNHML